jgi:hypothetical protein
VIRKSGIGVAVAAVVILLARSLAYATEPGPAARMLEHRAGGPALPVLALVTLAVAVAVAIAVSWLAALAVRERALLERRSFAPFRIRRLLTIAIPLAAVASLGGGLLEAYLHSRAGLGWHGLHCVFGPVHRDLLPFECGLSLVAAAVMAATEHVVAWMRRTFARLRALVVRARAADVSRRLVSAPLRHSLCVGSASARAPPAFACR